MKEKKRWGGRAMRWWWLAEEKDQRFENRVVTSELGASDGKREMEKKLGFGKNIYMS